MKKMLPALLIALTLLSASAAEPPRLSFDRPSKPGAYFNAEISLTAVREYTIALPGPDKPIERRESLNATLFAGIKVLEVDETGQGVVVHAGGGHGRYHSGGNAPEDQVFHRNFSSCKEYICLPSNGGSGDKGRNVPPAGRILFPDS